MCFNTYSASGQLVGYSDQLFQQINNDEEDDISENETTNSVGTGLKVTAAAGTVAAIGVPVAGTAALTGLGFTSAGIAAGSVAAGIQGPAVVAGSWFALAQSVGATGGLAILGPVGLFAGVAGAAIGGTGYLIYKATRKESSKKK